MASGPSGRVSVSENSGEGEDGGWSRHDDRPPPRETEGKRERMTAYLARSSVHLLRRVNRLLHGEGRNTGRNVDTKTGHLLGTLVLVHVEKTVEGLRAVRSLLGSAEHRGAADRPRGDLRHPLQVHRHPASLQSLLGRPLVQFLTRQKASLGLPKEKKIFLEILEGLGNVGRQLLQRDVTWLSPCQGQFNTSSVWKRRDEGLAPPNRHSDSQLNHLIFYTGWCTKRIRVLKALLWNMVVCRDRLKIKLRIPPPPPGAVPLTARLHRIVFRRFACERRRSREQPSLASR